MRSNRNIIFILVGLIAIVALVWFYSGDGKKEYNWETSLDAQDKEPYGLSVFSKTLSEKYPTFIKFTQHTIRHLSGQKERIDYFAIGHSLNYTRKELDTLYQFVRRGNNIFFSYKYVSDTTLMKFGIPKYELKVYKSTSERIGVNFTHPKLKQDSLIVFEHHKNYKEVSSFTWTYLSPVSEFRGKGLRQISDEFFGDEFSEDGYSEDIEGDEEYNEEYGDRDDEDAFGIEDTLASNDSTYNEDYVLDPDIEYYIDGSFYFGNDVLDEVEPVEAITDIAYMNQPDQIICKRYKVGEGYVYLLSEPLVLSNFYYTDNETSKVPQGILSHFTANKCILDLEAVQFKAGSISIDASNTPLQYMLSKKWFKVGIYALLFCALVYITLSTFRKQRPVPVFNLPENKSIEQIKNVASVLYYDKDIKKLQSYLKSSYHFWRNEHQLRLDKGIDEQADLDRLAFLDRKDIWDAKQIKEFQEKYNKLKSIYGN